MEQTLFEIPYLDTPTVLVGGLTFNMLVALILLGLIALLFLGVKNRAFGWNLAAIAAGFVVAGMLVVSHAEQLSHAKKLNGAWVQKQAEGRGVEIVAFVEKAPTKFYLWINIGGTPRAFWVPWTQKLQQSLQQAQGARERAGKSGNIWLRYGRPGDEGTEQNPQGQRFEDSLEEEQFYFHPMPWPAPPPKDEGGSPIPAQ